MAEISAQLVKQLREMTGAGMMECKKALVEAKGDLNEAEVILRKAGRASASKKSGRATRQGLVAANLSADQRLGVLVEVNCESDFVARTDEFQGMVKALAAKIAAEKPATVDALLASSLDGKETVHQMLTNRIATIGENMSVSRFVVVEASRPNGMIAHYMHPGSQLGVLVEIATGKPETLTSSVLAEAAVDIAMQVAAVDPKFLRKEDVTSDILDRERDIQKARALQEGKPAAIVDKVVEGRLSKFYEDFCLLHQPFIKDQGVTITQLLADKGKSLGDTVEVISFQRFKVGETAAEAAAEAN